jgi:hypothetical protein
MARFNVGGTSYNSTETTISPATVGDLEVAFTAVIDDADEFWVHPGTPIIADDRLYVSGASVVGFDRHGVEGCDGAPTTCAPVWTGTAPDPVLGPPAVAGDRVLALAADDDMDSTWASGGLVRFDATGATGCVGTAPVQCSPVWTLPVLGFSSPAIVGDWAFLYAALPGEEGFRLVAADMAACDAAPTSCEPAWVGPEQPVNYSAEHDSWVSPVVGNGLVYLPTTSGTIEVYEGLGCGGPVCAPAWEVTLPLGTDQELWVHSVAISGEAGFALGQILESSANTEDVIFAFDAVGTGCASHGECGATWAHQNEDLFLGWQAPVVTPDYVIALDDGAGGARQAMLLDPEGAACDTPPSGCPAIQTLAVPSDWVSAPLPTANPGLLWVVTEEGPLAYGLGTDACGVDNHICGPLWGAGMTGGEGMWTDWSSASVALGVVAAVEVEQFFPNDVVATLHVWRLPSD